MDRTVWRWRYPFKGLGLGFGVWDLSGNGETPFTPPPAAAVARLLVRFPVDAWFGAQDVRFRVLGFGRLSVRHRRILAQYLNDSGFRV